MTPLVSATSFNLSLSLLSFFPLSFFIASLRSRSVHHPYHPTTPGVDASRVVATGSERFNLPCALSTLRVFSLSLSFFLSSSRYIYTARSLVRFTLPFLSPSRHRCVCLVLDLLAYTHASIRDNKYVWCQPSRRVPSRLYDCAFVSYILRVHAAARRGRKKKGPRGEIPVTRKLSIPATLRNRVASFQGHAIRMRRNVAVDIGTPSRVLSRRISSRVDPYPSHAAVYFDIFLLWKCRGRLAF